MSQTDTSILGDAAKSLLIAIGRVIGALLGWVLKIGGWILTKLSSLIFKLIKK